MEKYYVENKDLLDELYNDSALTLIGLLEEGVEDFIKWIKKYTELKNEDVYIITGEVMNDNYGLTGDNSYPSDITIVCIKLSDMINPSTIIFPRFEIEGRWFDDIVDNNMRRESEE